MSSCSLGTGFTPQVDVSIKILHIIHMSLNDRIEFSKSDNLYEHRSKTLDAGL